MQQLLHQLQQQQYQYQPQLQELQQNRISVTPLQREAEAFRALSRMVDRLDRMEGPMVYLSSPFNAFLKAC